MRVTTRDAWALVPLRLVVGLGFAVHGYAKVARGPEHFGVILHAMSVPAPELMAWATSLLELIGGISVMMGAFVLPLSIPLIIVMATAMFGVHFRYGFSSVRLQAWSTSGAVFGPVGYELNLLYVAALLVLALSAPSPLSIDRWRRAGTRECGSTGPP